MMEYTNVQSPWALWTLFTSSFTRIDLMPRSHNRGEKENIQLDSRLFKFLIVYSIIYITELYAKQRSALDFSNA